MKASATARGEASPPGREDGEFRPRGAPRGLLSFYSLLSIAQKPKRGYDLMREIEGKTEGAWHPGPGAVYPVLQKLAQQGYIEGRKKPSAGSSQVVNEITTAGLGAIADAKHRTKSSSERMRLMSSLFVDLMDSEDLVNFVLSMFNTQSELLHAVIDSGKGGLSDQDKLFVLRQHRLNLERELGRTLRSMDSLGRQSRREGTGARPGPKRGAR